MIKLSQSDITNKEKKLVRKVLDEKFLGMGEYVNQFEKDLKKFLMTENDVVAVNTGTSAIQLALEAVLRKDSKKEIIIPSITYLSCFQACINAGGRPISCDINPKSMIICPNDLEKKITSDTCAILLVHYGGACSNREEIVKISKKYNLHLIEDCAHSFGSKVNNEIIGSGRGIHCFSFDGIKNITCGEGGAIVTSEKNISNFCKDARLLGVVKDTEKRYARSRTWEPKDVINGHRFHMQNLNAAIGIEQLKRIHEFKKKKLMIQGIYHKKLEPIKNVNWIHRLDKDILLHIFVVLVEKRNELKKFLLSNNIETGIHYYPNHYVKRFKSRGIPNAEKKYTELLSLPFHTNLKKSDIEYVCNKISEFYSR